MAMSKFMNLGLEDDEDLDILFLEVDNLREMVMCHK